MKQTVPESIRRLLALLLCAVMLLPNFTVLARAEEPVDENESTANVDVLSDEQPLAVIYAASDFQAYNNSTDDVVGGKNIMNAIIAKMQEAGYQKDAAKAVTGALFCGDYTAKFNTWSTSTAGDQAKSLAASNAGANAVEEVLGTAWGLTDTEVVYVQGNHDYDRFENIDPSGANDTEHYSVYVLHEDDFQWKQGDPTSSGNGSGNNSQAVTQATAENLEIYLQAKLDAKDNRPIFIASHLPLHFGWRTTSEKYGDNMYANLIFNVINDYANKGLNIIFLFGHNHSSTYDDYLGGTAVYLRPGDTIQVPQSSNTSYKSETLAFTYMNAGYVGYENSGCEPATLTSSIFEVYSDKVIVSRYDAAGLTNLQNPGIEDTSNLTPDSTPVTGSDTITLKTFHEDLMLGTLSSGKMAVGNTGVLTFNGLYNTTYDVVWASSDDTIVSVVPSEDGMSATLTANAAGEATITATATETGTVTRAVGDITTFTHTIEVAENASSTDVVLLDAGTVYSFFKKVDAPTMGKIYMILDMEYDAPVIGRHEALHYNRTYDADKEADKVYNNESTAYSNLYPARQEVNASGEDVFQLPIAGEVVTLVIEENENVHWEVNLNDTRMYIRTLNTNENAAGQKHIYLSASEGDQGPDNKSADYYLSDADHDQLRMYTKGGVNGGDTWNWDSNLGFYSNEKGDKFNYVLYYSQAQTDFSTYRIDLDGDTGLLSETADSRVYLFEQTTVTLDSAITAHLNDMTGYVNKDVGYKDDDGKLLGYTQTGDKIVITDGTATLEVPVTIDMITGDVNINAAGTYTGLTVTYAGVEITNDYTLVVNDTVTLLKNGTVANGAAVEYMDTIYALVDEMRPNRQYLIVDTDEAGIGHAMGVTDGESADAHNVLVQELPVDGKNMVLIDADRYSDKADKTTAGLVGRGIKEQGDINAYLYDLTSEAADYAAAVKLVWSTTQRVFPYAYGKSPEFYNAQNAKLFFLEHEYYNKYLSIRGNAEDQTLKLIDKPEDNSSEAYLQWRSRWAYDHDGNKAGLHLETGNGNSDQYEHAYLFYNWQNVAKEDDEESAANKNFQTEEATDGSFPMNPYRRVWIYERVTNIDTISARISDKSARVTARVEDLSEGTNNATFTGDYILVDTTHTDGTVTTEQVPVTISMLSGNYDLTAEGTYPNLTVTYQGKAICTDYTLIVDKFVANDYPEFPNEGAVRIDKQLDTTKYSYLDTGVASIDLSVTGIPAQTGVDLVIILDASSSMQRCVHHIKIGTKCTDCGYTISDQNNRMAILENNLEIMLETLQQPINGYAPDVDVAVATFNGYTFINSDYEFWYDGVVSGSSHNSLQQGTEERVDASQILMEFTDIADVNPEALNATAGRDIAYSNGTNYDRGMELAYQLLKEKQELNAMNGTTRDAFVVFMSDGVPYQYNYFQGDPDMTPWNAFLNGTLDTSDTAVQKQNKAVQAAFKKYAYHINKGGDMNKHWMAEAIKGDPNAKYTVIDRHAMTLDHITEVNGLGATMYAIGFGAKGESKITQNTLDEVLLGIASDAEHYIPANDNNALTKAFATIAGEVRSAGNAVFKDQMGQHFDLVTSNKLNVINDKGEPEVVDLSSNPPTITVKSYELYKRSEIGTIVNGVTVTETMVGSRKPVEPTVLETITFNVDGTVVSSNQKSGNILNGKVIEASTFFYNTDKVNAQNITVNGKNVSLEPETFYWNIGNIPETELVLSYSVYLNGSMEGVRPQGTYDTNKFAELTYTNYLGNDCKLSAPSPKLPWKQGTVGYAFYLVDGKGNPIINQTTGAIGSFENSVKITQPVYQDFYLNSEGEAVVATIIASQVMPEGYALYDTNAAYTVALESSGVGYYEVLKGKDTATTYIQGIQSTPVNPVGTFDTQDYLTANTIVWFAVTATVQCVPDTVVIDYGLPVDISVLANDTMMGNDGKLAYIGSTDQFTGYTGKLWEYLQGVDVVTEPKFNTEMVNGENGVITVQKDDEGKATGKVRYTLNESNGMQMKDEETFVYAVDYTGRIGTQGYYYSTVTIIPATTIYYEDNFVTYLVKNYDTAEVITDSKVQWTQEGTYNDVTQAEDRPGEFSLDEIDANNIYGFDDAYTNMTTYSMNNYHKVTVGKQTLSDNSEVITYANANFTFNGTGFDIVSVTSDQTGTIVVKVKGTAADGTSVSKNFMVDTYYGYYYDEETEQWIVDTDATYEGKNALYQIPVMKVSDLPYGKYDVTISVSHKELYDHGQYDGTKYDFYLDAIRIYDPANDGAGNQIIEDAYKADGEGWPSYQELRNMVINANDFNALEDGTQTSGAIFIDNTAAQGGKEYTIADYKSYGPNNELYLAPGQAVSFVLEAGKYTETVDGKEVTKYGQNIAGIHLAMKSVNGETIAKIYDGEKFKADEVTGKDVNTATDLYYDITDLNSKVVVIYNAGNSILSITNIKTTHLADPAGQTATTLMMSRGAASVALMSLRSEVSEPVEPEVPETTVPETTEPEVPETTVPETTEPEVPETTVPETTEPEVPETTVPETTEPEEEPEEFKPRKFKVSVDQKKVKVGATVVVTVTTSSDVDYITVNGEEITKFTTNHKKNERTWRIRVKAEEAGKLEISVVCYDDDDNASDPKTKTIEVTKKKNDKGNGGSLLGLQGLLDMLDMILGYYG